MSEPRCFPFGGVPVYNPLSLSKVEALAQFHARQPAYESLMDLLRQERPSHVLIIGTRGMGKTTLLQRVHYGVEDDAELNSRYLVLSFPEEQYNVTRLHRFLLNTVDALADAMERVRNKPVLERVEAFADLLGKLSPEEIEERVPNFLAEVGQEMGRSLLLLVDNADRLFETIEKREQWALRELLSNRRDLTFFGATTQASEGIYGPDRAFFEFFQIQRLTPLTLEEVRTLLLRLSESLEEREGEKGSAKRRVEEWLATDAARLRTLVQLTGGNPRTTVLLFHLVLDGLDGGAREYLEQLLDQCTPTYKGRVDELPSQAQQVLDAVALRWDPVTASEVAKYTGLETTTASAQLTRLVRQGLLEKADPGDSKKALYQVAERFFNIWYLMRASRRVRAKLRWFVEFLRVFFEASELEEMAWERFQRFGGAVRARPEEFETAFAYVLASGADRGRFENYLRRECAGVEAEWRPYLDLVRCAERTVRVRHGIQKGSLDDEEAAARKAIEIEPDNAENWRDLGRVLAGRREFTEAEAALRRATERDPKSAGSWAELGTLLAWIPNRVEDAEAAFSKALEIDPSSGYLWGSFGFFLACRAGKPREAEVALRKSVELEPTSPRNQRNLGALLYCEMHQEEEAVQHIRRAHQLDPEDPVWAAVLTACVRVSEAGEELLPVFLDASRHAAFWDEVLALCLNYAPFGKILLGVCDLVEEHDRSNGFVRLYRAVALAQLRDFPRASVALEDALIGDPIDLLSTGRRALEVFFAAAVRSGRVRDCLELLDKKDWKDAWRPIYEALRTVEEGSSEYLKRVAVEIREPAVQILRRIAPELPGLPARTS